jgi:hypothetical protein
MNLLLTAFIFIRAKIEWKTITFYIRHLCQNIALMQRHHSEEREDVIWSRHQPMLSSCATRDALSLA